MPAAQTELSTAALRRDRREPVDAKGMLPALLIIICIISRKVTNLIVVDAAVLQVPYKVSPIAIKLLLSLSNYIFPIYVLIYFTPW